MANAEYHKPSPVEEPYEVLVQRAAELSREKVMVEPETLRVAVFRIGRENAGIPAEYAQEVIWPIKQLTRVPGTPDFVLGVINLRGNILACLDLGIFLGIDAISLDSLTRMLLIRYDNVEMGVAIDEVSEVIDVPITDIDPPSSILNAERARFIKGVFYVEQRPLSLISIESLMHSERITSLREGAT